MFGREPERARIGDWLGLASDRPVGIALEGTAGIGKSTIWRDSVKRARDRGYLVLAAAPSESEMTLAFSGLGDLFDGLDTEPPMSLPEPQRRALRSALFLSDPSDAPDDLDALPRAVLNALRELATTSTVVVAIDDEQWLDGPSARVLAFALRRVREERICLLLSRRTGSDGALWTEVRDAFAPGIELLPLGAIDVADTHRLLARTLSRKVPRRLLERVHDVSGGNPLYVLALAEELKRMNGDASDWRELPIPRTLVDAIARRLDRVRTGVEAPLFAVAALADPTVALLAAALDEFDASAFDEAVRAGVIELTGERVRFTHPLLASVHYSSIPAPERRELHLRLADAVPDREQRARHLALGIDTPDEHVASELEHAAAAAARRGAPEAAAELLEHAIRLTPVDQDEARWSRTVTAAEQHYLAGDFEEARMWLERLLLEQPTGQISARARVQLAKVRTDDFEFASSMLEQALVDAGDDDRLITEIELNHTDLSANLGDYAGTVRHADAAVVSAERLREPGALASALAQQGVGLFNAGQGMAHGLFERAIELEHTAGDARPTYWLPSTTYGTLLRIENDLDGARPLLTRALARARRRGEGGDTLIALLVRLAWLESEAGHLEASDEWLAQARQLARQHVNDEMDSWVAHVGGETAASRGELERARLLAAEVLRLAHGNRDVQMQRNGDVLLANIELWSGKPKDAHELLHPWRERTIVHGPWYLGWSMLELWSSDIEALIALERVDHAQPVVDDLLKRALAYPNPHGVAIAKRCQGLLLAARGDHADAIDALDIAVAEHARRRLPLELGRTLLEKGSLERRAKRKTIANQTLEQALAVLEPLGAAIWVARTRDELGRIGLRRAAERDSLTPAQQRVAELAASGATNREIAQTLYMSERTVESHLTKTYRELGIRSRAQLADGLAARGLRDAPESVSD